MKLTKILNYDALQAYSISKPSKRFKLMFPLKYIIILAGNNCTKLFNIDSIPTNFAYMNIVGYIFTYCNKLPDFFGASKLNKYTNYGSTCPGCLDQYFTDNANDIDLILSICSKDKEMPLNFKDNLIIRCNSNNLINVTNSVENDHKTLRKNIMNIINSSINEHQLSSTEDWLNNIINNVPLNDNGFPVKYPKIITDKSFHNKSCNINYEDIFIQYDFRASSYDHENSFISSLENAFENKNTVVYIYNSYNDIMNTIIKKLDEKHLKYNKLEDDLISTSLKNLHKIDVEYKLTDFI